MTAEAGRLIAVLGPTNTGKTHYAVERMLGHASGMIGFPLRLLAREIYDRVTSAVGASRVALITGEEKIVPTQPAYWICTVESMPLGESVDFLAVDEIQLAADDQRGHVFTERLLHARGREETVLMGSQTIAPLIRRLLPDAQIVTRTRFSRLSFVAPSKLARLPRRSAIIGFSAETVYALAELVRRHRGGAAVVMGALSPRTRNAQVELYQNGDVDYIVATDAIGMGLNMDIDHVAFAETAKFDGRTTRRLEPAEVGQIAGRAGRHMNDGTFSTLTGDGTATLDPMTISRVEAHEFRPLKNLLWRNARLDFRSPGRLVASLEAEPTERTLARMRDALDLASLKALSAEPEIASLARHPAAVRRLWEVCQIPDFRKHSASGHLALLRRIYIALMSPEGVIPRDWLAREVSRLDNTQGDIDTLASRITSIRTWTYIANRQAWLTDSAHWVELARRVEDKLSDALHDRLTQRFVDRRSSVLLRQLRQQGSLSVNVGNDGDIEVEGQPIGRLKGFSFHADPSAAAQDFKLLESAADKVLKFELDRRAKLFANVGQQELKLDFSRGLHRPVLLWGEAPIAVVEQGGTRYSPRVDLVNDSRLSGPGAERVLATCQAWLNARLRDKLGPLMSLEDELEGKATGSSESDAPLEGLARGIAFRLLENYGILPRRVVAGDLRQLDQTLRRGLRRFKIRIGATALYIPAILKPHATELRLILWALETGQSELPEPPPPGLVWISTDPKAPREFYELAGYRLIGKHEAVRLDMMERLADAVRPLGQNGAVFHVTPEIMGLVGCSGDSFARAMRCLGYAHETCEAEPDAPAVKTSTTEETAATPQEAGAADGASPSPETASSDEHNDNAASSSPAEPQPVTTYRFWWAPSKTRRPATKRSKPNTPSTGKTAPDGRKQHRKATKTSKPKRAPGRAAGDTRKPRATAQGKSEAVNADSPFAQLKDLKEALEKRR